MEEKDRLRSQLRAQRRAHVSSLADATSQLLFLRPPSLIAAMIPPDAIVGLYHASEVEAPTRSYARWLHENGRKLALPWFARRGAAMQFRQWADPYDDAALSQGPFGQFQPALGAGLVLPEVVLVPIIGFTAQCDRLGQGGGHYDRWLESHPQVRAIGLAWDCQLVDRLPLEAHDQRISAVVTPTRLYESADHA